MFYSRENPEKIFEVFTEIARPNQADDEPFVLQKYPEDFCDEVLVLQGVTDYDVICSITSYRIPVCPNRSAVPNRCAGCSSNKIPPLLFRTNSHQMPDKTSKDHQETAKFK